MDPLKTMNIPDTETMRSLSLHFRTSWVPYEEDIRSLEKNEPAVRENWQADGSVAYVQKNQHLVERGLLHVEQMQNASQLFDATANQFDEGKVLQTKALWEWGKAKAAELALNMVEATSWELLAQQSMDAAWAMVESARAYFNSGFAALHAKLTGTQSLPQGGQGWETAPVHGVDTVSVSQTATPVKAQGSQAVPSPDQQAQLSSVPVPSGEQKLDTSTAKEIPPAYAPSVPVATGEQKMGLSAANGAPPAYAKGEPHSFDALMQLLFNSEPQEEGLPAYSKTPLGGEQSLDSGPAHPSFMDKPGDVSKSGEKGVAADMDPRQFTHFPATNITARMVLTSDNNGAPHSTPPIPIADGINTILDKAGGFGLVYTLNNNQEARNQMQDLLNDFPEQEVAEYLFGLKLDEQSSLLALEAEERQQNILAHLGYLNVQTLLANTRTETGQGGTSIADGEAMDTTEQAILLSSEQTSDIAIPSPTARWTLRSRGESVSDEEKSVQEDVDMESDFEEEVEEQSTSAEEPTPRYNLRANRNLRGGVEETNTTSAESSDDESIMVNIQELLSYTSEVEYIADNRESMSYSSESEDTEDAQNLQYDGSEVEDTEDAQEWLLDASEQANILKETIDGIIGKKTIPVIFTPNSDYSDLKDKIVEELTSKKYAPEGKVEYIRLLTEEEQAFILRLGFGSMGIDEIRHLLSRKELNLRITAGMALAAGTPMSIALRQKPTILVRKTTFKSVGRINKRKRGKISSNKKKVEFALNKQVNKIKNGIDNIIGKYSIKRAFVKESLEKKIRAFLKNERYTPKILAKYIELLPQDERPYMLLLGFDQYRSGAVWQHLSPEVQAAYRLTVGITDPEFQMPSYSDVESPLSSDSELDDFTPAASLTTIQQAKMIKMRIDTICGVEEISPALLENVIKRDEIYTILHEDGYVLEAKVRYLKSLREKEQGSVLRYAFEEGEVADLWSHLSEGAKKAALRLGVQLPPGEEPLQYEDLQGEVNQVLADQTLYSVEDEQEEDESLSEEGDDFPLEEDDVSILDKEEEEFLLEDDDDDESLLEEEDEWATDKDLQGEEQSVSEEEEAEASRSINEEYQAEEVHFSEDDEDESVSEEAAKSASDSEQDDSAPVESLAPLAQAKHIEKRIEEEGIPLTMLSRTHNKSAFRKIVHESGYTPKGQAMFVNRRPENEQGYVLVVGFLGPERTAVWKYLSSRAKKAYRHRQGISDSAFKPTGVAILSSESEQDDSAPVESLAPLAQAKKIEKLINATPGALTTLNDNVPKKKEVRRILHTLGYTPEGQAKYVNTRPEKDQGYLLVVGFVDAERKAVWDHLSPDAQEAFRRRWRIKNPGVKLPSYAQRNAMTLSQEEEEEELLSGEEKYDQDGVEMAGPSMDEAYEGREASLDKDEESLDEEEAVTSSTPLRQAESIKKRMEATKKMYGPLASALVKKKKANEEIRKNLHEHGYTAEGKAEYFKSLTDKLQGQILKRAFNVDQRADIWPYLSDGAKQEALRLGITIPANAVQKIPTTLLTLSQEEEEAVTSSTSLRQAERIKKDIERVLGETALIYAVSTNVDNKRKLISDILHKNGYTLAAKVAYLRKLTDQQQGYVLFRVFPAKQWAGLWPYLSEGAKQEALKRGVRRPSDQKIAHALSTARSSETQPVPTTTMEELSTSTQGPTRRRKKQRSTAQPVRTSTRRRNLRSSMKQVSFDEDIQGEVEYDQEEQALQEQGGWESYGEDTDEQELEAVMEIDGQEEYDQDDVAMAGPSMEEAYQEEESYQEEEEYDQDDVEMAGQSMDEDYQGEDEFLHEEEESLDEEGAVASSDSEQEGSVPVGSLTPLEQARQIEKRLKAARITLTTLKHTAQRSTFRKIVCEGNYTPNGQAAYVNMLTEKEQEYVFMEGFRIKETKAVWKHLSPDAQEAFRRMRQHRRPGSTLPAFTQGVVTSSDEGDSSGMTGRPKMIREAVNKLINERNKKYRRHVTLFGVLRNITLHRLLKNQVKAIIHAPKNTPADKIQFVKSYKPDKGKIIMSFGFSEAQRNEISHLLSPEEQQLYLSKTALKNLQPVNTSTKTKRTAYRRPVSEEEEYDQDGVEMAEQSMEEESVSEQEGGYHQEEVETDERSMDESLHEEDESLHEEEESLDEDEAVAASDSEQDGSVLVASLTPEEQAKHIEKRIKTERITPTVLPHARQRSAFRKIVCEGNYTPNGQAAYVNRRTEKEQEYILLSGLRIMEVRAVWKHLSPDAQEAFRRMRRRKYPKAKLPAFTQGVVTSSDEDNGTDMTGRPKAIRKAIDDLLSKRNTIREVTLFSVLKNITRYPTLNRQVKAIIHAPKNTPADKIQFVKSYKPDKGKIIMSFGFNEAQRNEIIHLLSPEEQQLYLSKTALKNLQPVNTSTNTQQTADRRPVSEKEESDQDDVEMAGPSMDETYQGREASLDKDMDEAYQEEESYQEEEESDQDDVEWAGQSMDEDYQGEDEFLHEEEESLDEEGAVAASDVDLDDSIPAAQLRPLQQARKIRRLINATLADLTTLGTNEEEKAAVQNILREKGYTPEGLAQYLQFLSETEQGYVLAHGFSKLQRSTVWDLVSPKAQAEWSRIREESFQDESHQDAVGSHQEEEVRSVSGSDKKREESLQEDVEMEEQSTSVQKPTRPWNLRSNMKQVSSKVDTQEEESVEEDVEMEEQPIDEDHQEEAATSSSGSELDDSVPVASLTPEEQEKKIREQINATGIRLTAFFKNLQKKGAIKAILHKKGITPEGKAKFVNSLPKNEQGYVLVHAFKMDQRGPVWEHLSPEAQNAYLRTGAKAPTLSSGSELDDSVSAASLTPEEQKKRIEEKINTSGIFWSTFFKNPQKKKIVNKILHKSGYTPEGQAKYINSLASNKQGYVLVNAFDDPQRKAVWKHLSSSAQAAYRHKTGVKDPAFTRREATSSSGSELDESVPVASLSPLEQAKKIRKQISNAKIAVNNIGTYPSKKKKIRHILHKMGYTPEGQARYINLLSENKQASVLRYGFDIYQRGDVWEYLSSPAQDAYRHTRNLPPSYNARRYPPIEAPLSSDSEPDDSVPVASLTPSQQAKKIRKQIRDARITLTTFAKNSSKMNGIKHILHENGYTPEGLARYIASLRVNMQGYILVNAFNAPQRRAIRDLVSPEANAEYSRIYNLNRKRDNNRKRYKNRKTRLQDPVLKQLSPKQRGVASKVLLQLLQEDISALMGITPINMQLIDNENINQGLKYIFGKEIFSDAKVKAAYLGFLDDDASVYILKHIFSDEQRASLWSALSDEVKEAWERDSQTSLAQNLASDTTPDPEVQSAVQPDLSTITQEYERILKEIEEKFMNELRFPSGITLRQLYTWIDSQEVSDPIEEESSATLTEPPTSEKTRQSVQEPIGSDMETSNSGKRRLPQEIQTEAPISKRTRSQKSALSTEASSSLAPVSAESIPPIEAPISQRTRSRGSALSTEASTSLAPASSESIPSTEASSSLAPVSAESIPPIEEILNAAQVPRALSDYDLALIMLKTALKKDWDEVVEEDWDEGTEEMLPPLLPLVIEEEAMTGPASTRIPGGGMSSMIETVNPPQHRIEPLTPADLNVIQQQQLNTATGALYNTIARVPFVTGNRPAETVAGGGTYYDDVANFLVSDPFDPRLGSNEIHEWVHIWSDNNNPPPRRLGALRWIAVKIFQEKEAQMRAMDYMNECLQSGLRQRHDIDMVYPALMKEFRQIYLRFFSQFLIRANLATQNNVRRVYTTISNNPNTQLNQFILQNVGPMARQAGENYVMAGILRGDVITANTGHTYIDYFGMLRDHRFLGRAGRRGWGGRRAAQTFRIVMGLPILRAKKIRLQSRAADAGAAALVANQLYNNYVQARTRLNQQLVASNQQIATLNQQIATLNQQIATLNQQIAALNQQIAAANRPAIGAARVLGPAIRRNVQTHRRTIAGHRQTIAGHQQTIARHQQTIRRYEQAISVARRNHQGALQSWTSKSYLARKLYKQLIAAEAINRSRAGTTFAPFTQNQNIQLTQGSQKRMGTRWSSLIQAQATFQTSLARVNKWYAGNMSQKAFSRAKGIARSDLALLWEQEILARDVVTDMPHYIEIQARYGTSYPGVITRETEQALERKRFWAVFRFHFARRRLVGMQHLARGLGEPFKSLFLRPYRSRVHHLRVRIRRIYARLRWVQRINNRPIVRWSATMQPKMRTNKVMRPYIILPDSVETLPPPPPSSIDKDHAAAQWYSEPFRWVDMQGQLLQNPEHRFVQTLASTEMGRRTLQVEQEYGGPLWITNGTASSYKHNTNTLIIGLGPRFALDELFAQKKLIHEETHRYRAQAGLMPDPLKYTQKEWVERMMIEEAIAEGNAAEHVMDRRPAGPFTRSEQIYVDAFRAGYRKGYEDLQEEMPWATEEQLHEAGRKAGRLRGREALLQAMKEKVLVPSTVPQDLTKSPEEVYGYEEYYADQHQRALDMQKAEVVNPSPDEVDFSHEPLVSITEETDGSTTMIKHGDLT